MSEYVVKTDGNIERTYLAPNVDNLPLASVALRSGGVRPRTVVTVTVGDVMVNGERVHPFDLIGFCDAILATFTGEQLTRARAL